MKNHCTLYNILLVSGAADDVASGVEVVPAVVAAA